jgi:hypothetical protein
MLPSVALGILLSSEAFPTFADAISMADLIGDKTITCGNFKFSKFEYSDGNVPGFPAAAAVSVDCTTIAGMNGISVTGPWSYALMDGKSPSVRLAYLVTALQGTGIVGATLNADMTIKGGDGTISGSETKFPAFNDCYT